MLTRSQYLELCGWTNARFQAVSRRNLDRLNEEWGEASSEDLDRWHAARRKYVWRDVLLLRAVDSLTFNGGLNLDVAFSAAGNLVMMAEQRQLEDREKEIWGAVAFYSPEGRSHHVGTFASIADAMRWDPSWEDEGWNRYPVARVVLVNISNAARNVEAAAAESGFLVKWDK